MVAEIAHFQVNIGIHATDKLYTHQLFSLLQEIHFGAYKCYVPQKVVPRI